MKRVEPLRNELTELSDAAKQNRKKSQETEDLIAQLEMSIARYTEEYAALISQAQTIKSDLASVEGKVGYFLHRNEFMRLILGRQISGSAGIFEC